MLKLAYEATSKPDSMASKTSVGNAVRPVLGCEGRGANRVLCVVALAACSRLWISRKSPVKKAVRLD